MKLSVLIPAYNPGNWLRGILDSLRKQIVDHPDTEIIIVDDGSTEDLAWVMDYPGVRYIRRENGGEPSARNMCLKMATGEYIHIHDSDDYVYTDLYEALINRLDGADIYCMDLIVNDGSVFHIDEAHKRGYCAQIARFIRREFADGLQFPEDQKAGDDWFFAEALLERNPATIYTGVPAYHYNFPREGSLFDMKRKGLL